MTVTTKTLAVSSIENGTVIDHIDVGNALAIVKLLKLPKHQKRVTVGLNLPSNRMGYKDIIKVEDREISPDEVNQIAILAPEATINIIQNYEISRKFKIAVPDVIIGIIDCPNLKCISNYENVAKIFHVLHRQRRNIRLQCRYCRTMFSQEKVG